MSTARDIPTLSLAQAFHRQWPVVGILGLLSLALGAAVVMHPLPAAGTLTRLLGALAVAEGVLLLLAGLSRWSLLPRVPAVAFALGCLLAGLLACFWPLQMASLVLVFIAAWLLVAGVFRVLAGLRVLRATGSGWLLLVSGLFTAALGALFALNPDTGLAVTMLWFGVLALAGGVLQLLLAIHLWRHRPR